MPQDEAAAVLPREPNDLEKLLMEAKRYVLAFSIDPRNHTTAREVADSLMERIDTALTAGPRGDLVNGSERAELAKMIHDYYMAKIGTMMHQAEHWAAADREHPKAVHHRLYAADDYFQVANMFDPARLKLGWKSPWEEMEREMSTPFFKTQERGAYPPSVELHRYRDPRFVVERLNNLLAEGKNRG